MVFIVSGRGQFPFDMLRSDRCWPNSSFDAQQMGGEARRVITLQTDERHSTAARWASFDWTVVEERIG